MAQPLKDLLFALRNGVLVMAVMFGFAAALRWLFAPLLASAQVSENVTTIFANVLTALLPTAGYIASSARLRALRQDRFPVAMGLALVAAVILALLVILVQNVLGDDTATTEPSLGLTLAQTADGIVIEAVEPGTPAEAEGFQVGDVITAVRRDPVTLAALQRLVAEADLDDAVRLRFLRDGEEMQLTARVVLVETEQTTSALPTVLLALVTAAIALLIPGGWVPHLLLIGSLLPLLIGYLWLIIATFSQRTHGLLPVDTNGDLGGWTLNNWQFLTGQSATGQAVDIWGVTFNSLLIAVVMTVTALLVCSMTGYALSRMNFPGRRSFLTLTLLLHGFPAVTLIIPIFLVLINLAGIPLIGRWFGFNTPGGIALVMVAFELPLGVWLMKGFFDSISWDMERSALIDGASRWRTFWEIILPQIRPGLLALGIFSFIGGWNAYLIPATYSVGTSTANLPVFINQLAGEVSPVNWNQVAAVGLFQLVPIFIFFIFAQEYLLNMYAGGTKGSS